MLPLVGQSRGFSDQRLNQADTLLFADCLNYLVFNDFFEFFVRFTLAAAAAAAAADIVVC